MQFNGEQRYDNGRFSERCRRRVIQLLLVVIAGAGTYQPVTANDDPSFADLLHKDAVGPPDQSTPFSTAIEVVPSSQNIIDEVSTGSVPASSANATWLDIRPRAVRTETRILVSAKDLPEDTSGLPEIDSTVSAPYLCDCDLGLKDFMWGASFCHYPLYFEDPYLERYGMATACVNRAPAVQSAANFAWKTSLLPVSMALDPPWQRQTSGFHQPYWMRTIKAIR